MKRRPWMVLLCGFGGLLVLMAAAEGSALLFLDSLRASESRLQQHFLSRNSKLEQIRSFIYLSGTFARDSLLAPEPSGAKAQISALEALQRDTSATLDQYAQSLEPEEVAPFQSLRTGIEAYWKVLDRTFAWTPEERRKYRYEFFYNELIPRRTSMLQVADRVAQLNEQELRRGNRELSSLFGKLRLGLVITITLTLIGGATLAVFTSLVILRLQDEAQRRLEESVLARAALQDLSAKLVRAQEDERRSLSRELHDEAGQSFSAILMEAENLRDLHHPAEVLSHLEAIRALARRGLNETRNMALLLRPSMLDDFGLVPALDWQARETSKRTGLQVRVTANNIADDLPEEHKTCVYRVVQEALANSARHAQAANVQVVVTNEPEKILLTVRDDGTGFDAQHVRGLGLLGMQERVTHLGGSFAIDSQPGRGTLVAVQLPLASLSAEVKNGSHANSVG